MATSLASQLRRLETPQTSLLVDTKTRPSIIFDEKDAANKDRKTIYDLGHSGLMELVKLNPHLIQFEQTLFDYNSIEIERSVESPESNVLLDKGIKKFLYHLSPYFMLHPAQLCLEWLIRRFHIHEFNKDDFIALVLPYHETKIFVRCIQILKFRNDADKWLWLKPIQKPGVPLSKTALLNHAVSNPQFLKFICKTTKDAVKELESVNKAHTLQVKINFYCVCVLGTLEYTQAVGENHLTSILEALLKGFDSVVVDYTAASLMITAQLLSKSKLNADLLNAIIKKICKIQHTKLQSDIILVLILLYQSQKENFQNFPHATLTQFVKNKWVTEVLAVLSAQKILINTVCVPLVGSSLQIVQKKEKNFEICKDFLEKLLIDVHFNTEDVKHIIRAVLDNYYKCEKSKANENDVIEISESEDDNPEICVEEDIQKWYSNYLQKLERQYPNEFDFTIKETMEDLQSVSESRKSAFKTVLAFRLKSSYSEDNTNIYENLYHHNPKNRQEAVKYLIKNFTSLNLKVERNDMMKDTILDRLNDDNPIVVFEILKLDTETLVNLISACTLSEKLVEILTKSQQTEDNMWFKVITPAFKHLINKEVLEASNKGSVILTIIPFLLFGAKIHLSEILSQEELKSIPFLKHPLPGIASKTKIDNFDKILSASLNLPEPVELLKSIENVKVINPGYFLMILTCSLINNKNVDTEIGLKCLEVLQKYKKRISDGSDFLEKIKHNKIPLNLHLIFLLNLAKNIKCQLNSAQNYEVFKLINKIYEELLTKSFSTREMELKIKFTDKLKEFLEAMFPKITDKLKFLSDFFYTEKLNEYSEEMLDTQIRSLKLFNIIARSENNYELENLIFHKILIGLCSKISTVRELALESMSIFSINKTTSEDLKVFITKVLARNEEILMDEEQFPLFLCTIIDPGRVKIFENSAETKSARLVLQGLLDAIDTTDGHLKVEFLKLIKHINNPSIIETLLKNQSFDDSKDILNDIDGEIFKLILYRFNENTVAGVLKKSNSLAWTFIEKSLKSINVFIRVPGNLESLPSVLIKHFEEEIFEKFPHKLKAEFINLGLLAASSSEDPAMHKSFGKFIKQSELKAEYIRNVLVNMISLPRNEEYSTFNATSSEMLNSLEWKCGITLLEFLQNKKKIINGQNLICPLFDILKKCLDYAEQTSVEYVKQLLLSCILNVCQLEKSFKNPEKVFKIDLVVNCIRATNNPQTHHHALVLLSHCAIWVPQLVLHNIINIFTFMGSTVVRHDDVYSFQLISNIIESIIPMLVKLDDQDDLKKKQLVIPVLKVFSDIITDVPEHRRLPLYTKFLRTLGAENYLWMFLCVLFENQVHHDTSIKIIKKSSSDNMELPKRISIALELSKQFEPEIVLETCIQLFIYLRKLPMEKEENLELVKNKNLDYDKTIFDVNLYSAKQLRHFKYMIMTFISMLTSSYEFVNSITVLSNEGITNLKPYFQNYIIKILSCIPDITKALDKVSCKTDNSSNNKGGLEYWKIMLKHCYGILDNAISLLSPDLFLVVIHGLMKHPLPNVRKKIIELLVNKLQYNSDYFQNSIEENFMKLLEPLIDVVDSILTGEKIMVNATSIDIHAIQQLSLIAIKLLSKLSTNKSIVVFKDILNKLAKIISKRRFEISEIITASVVLTISEVCSNLKAHSISHLPKFMPHFVEILKRQEKHLLNNPPDSCCVATLTGIQKLFETLPLFLGPYLQDIIIVLIKMKCRCLPRQEVDQKSTIIISKVDIISNKLSTVIPLRILLPKCDVAYDNLMDQKEYSGLKHLMKMLTKCFEHVAPSDITAHQNELTKLFLKSLEFRSNTKESIEEINFIEEDLLEGFVSLILKLSESSFRPLYQKVYDWGIRNNTNKDRIITFFLLSSKLSESLKSLFVLFAADFIEDAASLLDKSNRSKSEAHEKHILDSNEDDRKELILIEHILKTLCNVFLYSSKGFMNTNRFDILMQPIVDQLENPLLEKEENVLKILKNCVAQLAVAASNDSLWKQLNYQVLLKTRSNSSTIRIISFSCCVEVARKLGEDFSSLLPETIPFVAELLEDENQSVEKNTKKCVQELEKILGESLQSYF